MSASIQMSQSGAEFALGLLTILIAVCLLARGRPRRFLLKDPSKGFSIPQLTPPGLRAKRPLPSSVDVVTVEVLIGDVVCHISHLLRVDVTSFRIWSELNSGAVSQQTPLIDHFFQRLNESGVTGETLVADNDLRQRVIQTVTFVMMHHADIGPNIAMLNPPAFERLNKWLHRVSMGDTVIENPDNNAASRLMRSL